MEEGGRKGGGEEGREGGGGEGGVASLLSYSELHMLLAIKQNPMVWCVCGEWCVCKVCACVWCACMACVCVCVCVCMCGVCVYAMIKLYPCVP